LGKGKPLAADGVKNIFAKDVVTAEQTVGLIKSHKHSQTHTHTHTRTDTDTEGGN